MEFDSVDQTDDDGPGPQRCNFKICLIVEQQLY